MVFDLFSDECIPSRASRKSVLLDSGWDSNPRPSNFSNDALPSEQGQAENDLLSYDVIRISEVRSSLRKASYYSPAMLYVNVVVSHVN